jgi:hypothetical protein
VAVIVQAGKNLPWFLTTVMTCAQCDTMFVPQAEDTYIYAPGSVDHGTPGCLSIPCPNPACRNQVHWYDPDSWAGACNG